MLLLTWETTLTFWPPHGQSHSPLGIPLAGDLVHATGRQEHLAFVGGIQLKGNLK